MESVRLATSLCHWFIFIHECWLKCIIFSYRVIVGAPKSNVTDRNGANLGRYGAAFRCPYPVNKPCDEIQIDKTRKCRTLLVFIQYSICMYLWQLLSKHGRCGSSLELPVKLSVLMVIANLRIESKEWDSITVHLQILRDLWHKRRSQFSCLNSIGEASEISWLVH